MKHVKAVLINNTTLIGLLVLIALFSFVDERFLSISNARVILLQVAELGIVVVPLALLLISGSVDLSVGSVMSMGGVASAMVMAETGSAALGILAGLAFGLVAGAVNGFLVVYAGFNAIVVTLASLAVWGGLALYITSGESQFDFPDWFREMTTFRLFGEIPLAAIIAVLIFIGGWWILARSRFGRYIYAVGGNERAAFLMGVAVNRIRFVLFIAVGIASALAGILLSVKLGAATPTAGRGLELQALTVILLGGVAFAGGSGRIGGVLAGLLFVGVLQNGLIVIGTSQFLQQVFVGLALLFAVALNDSVRRWGGSSRSKSTG
jgi:ribose/xylose/arabinose/galactoside ABC-type transport system permease subunit